MIDDQTLARQAHSDPRSFLMLYEKYVHPIYLLAYYQTGDGVLAQDIVSATFEKALRHIRRHPWHGDNFRAWLYRIARNEIAQYYRYKRYWVQLSDLFRSDVDVEQTIENAQEHDAVQIAVLRLPARDRELIALRFFDQLPTGEIAEILGITPDNLYVRLHRAIARLRKELAGNQAVRKEDIYVSK